MKQAALSSASNEQLVKLFAEAAITHKELRTAKEANRAFDEAVAIAKELKRRGNGALALLSRCLNHPTLRSA